MIMLARRMSLSSLGYTQELHAGIPTYAHYSATEQVRTTFYRV
jgi:hypothetical protein